jgi:hypothetical protein
MAFGGTNFPNLPYFQLVEFWPGASSFAVRHSRDGHLLIR